MIFRIEILPKEPPPPLKKIEGGGAGSHLSTKSVQKPVQTLPVINFTVVILIVKVTCSANHFKTPSLPLAHYVIYEQPLCNLTWYSLNVLEKLLKYIKMFKNSFLIRFLT